MRAPVLARSSFTLRGVLRRGIRPAIYAVGMVPAAWTLNLALTDQLGADPVKVLERTLGLWALRFLVLGLAISPLRRTGGPNLPTRTCYTASS